MSVSDCLHCGGRIDLGPDKSNCCTTCGKSYWSSPDPVPSALLKQFNAWLELCDKLGYKVEYNKLSITKKDPP